MGAAGAKEELLRREEIQELEEMSGFSGSQILELYKRFIRLDRSGKAQITKSDLMAIPELAMNPLVERVIAHFKFNERSRINFIDFVRLLAVFDTRGDPERIRQLHKVYFDVFDVDQDGFISPKELFHIMKLMVGTYINDEELQVMAEIIIAEVDTDGDGQLNFAEFIAALSLKDLGEPETRTWRRN